MSGADREVARASPGETAGPSRSAFARPSGLPLPEVLSFIALAAALVTILLISPPVGIADNADFARVAGPAGIAHLQAPPEDLFWNWARFDYRFAPTTKAEYLLSAIGFAKVARALHWLFASGTPFRIQFLGALYACWLLLGAVLLLAAQRRGPFVARMLVCIGLPLVIGDVAYLCTFNSFYGEPPAMIALVWIAALVGLGAQAVPTGRRRLLLLGLGVWSVVLVFGKPQYFVAGPLLACLVLWVGARTRVAGAPRRSWWLPGVVAAAVMALSLVSFSAVPAPLRRVTLFNLVFSEVLVHDGPPAQVLSELGLDPSLAVYAGKTVWSPDVQFFGSHVQSHFVRRIGHGRILRYYLTHPSRLLALLERVAPLALETRQANFANFAREAGYPAATLARRLSSWTDVKSRFGPKHFGGLCGLFAGLLALVALARRARGASGDDSAWVFGGGAIAIGWLQLGVVTVGDFHADFVRHMLVGNFAWDLGALMCLGYLLASAAAKAARAEAGSTGEPT